MCPVFLVEDKLEHSAIGSVMLSVVKFPFLNEYLSKQECKHMLERKQFCSSDIIFSSLRTKVMAAKKSPLKRPNSIEQLSPELY